MQSLSSLGMNGLRFCLDLKYIPYKYKIKNSYIGNFPFCQLLSTLSERKLRDIANNAKKSRVIFL